jgi:hypothetical protein
MTTLKEIFQKEETKNELEKGETRNKRIRDFIAEKYVCLLNKNIKPINFIVSDEDQAVFSNWGENDFAKNNDVLTFEQGYLGDLWGMRILATNNHFPLIEPEINASKDRLKELGFIDVLQGFGL